MDFGWKKLFYCLIKMQRGAPQISNNRSTLFFPPSLEEDSRAVTHTKMQTSHL